MRVFNAARAALCLALAAGMLAGCAPAGPAASETAAASEAAAGSALDDGVLRFLYSTNSSGGGTLLRGGQILYQAEPSESVTLLTAPGSSDAVGWQLGRNDPLTGTRATEVYDADGSLLWAGSGDWRATLADGLLALEPGSYGVDYGPSSLTGCRLIDLASGQDIPLPANASGCIPVGGGQAVLTLTIDPDAPYASGTDVVVLDLATGAELSRIRGAYAYPAYGYDQASGYAAAQRYDAVSGGWTAALYLPGEGWLEGYEGFVGPGLICYNNGAGFAVRTAADPFTLCFDEMRILYYRPDDGLCILSSDDGALLQTRDGRARPLYGYAGYEVQGDEVVCLLADGTLLFCPAGGGETAIPTGLVPDETQWASLMTAPAGWALVSVSGEDGDYARLYDAEGLVYDSAGAKYRSITYLTMGPDGPLLAASYPFPNERSAWLTDVVDPAGSILLEGLADVNASSVYSLPDGVFAARRGFERGFMDFSGRWLYSESVFTTIVDEDAAWYY